MKNRKLNVFYDGLCPLCSTEMKQLDKYDTCKSLHLVDIHQPGFAAAYPHIDIDKANRKLHAQYNDGEMIYGLDVTHQAWAMVGRNTWLKVLRWPLVRWIADGVYLLFARFRYPISFLLTGKRRRSKNTQRDAIGRMTDFEHES